MTSRERRVDRADRRSRTALRRMGDELIAARRQGGLSQEAIARATGMSRSQVSRIERGEVGCVCVNDLFRIAAVTGLDVALRLFPFGDPMRDAGHVRLLNRLRGLLHPSLRMATEVPIPIPGDLPAWDAVIVGRDWRQPTEAETVLDDVQALERRLALKQRDAGVERLLVVIAATNRNRAVLRGAPGAFAAFPLRGTAVIRALQEGRQPGGSGLILL